MGYLYVYMKLLDIIFESVVDLNEKKGVKMTQDEFIQQATKKWNGKYTYDNVNYVNQKSKNCINTQRDKIRT